ncbi:MAG: transporter suffix domain-containing protein [Draconibacterium sp.]|nr:transporter suffix domain-containing protein [Draconibacterium sp.]
MSQQKQKKNFQIKLGIFLMIFSGVFFAATFIIPMFDLPTKTKVIASTTSLILMEVVFWSGGLLVGKELFTKYKNQLNPKNWFKKKNVETESNIDKTSEK